MENTVRHRLIPEAISATGVLALIGLGSLTSCGDPLRSVEGYCTTVRTEQDRLSAKYEDQAEAIGAASDPALGLIGAAAMIVGAHGDLVVYFDRLSAVAPTEIQPEMEAVRDAFEESADDAKDALSDPLGTFFGAVVNGLQMQGSLDVVNDFTLANCGISI